MGSSIMSVEYNSGDQYSAKSGTSMATPGAAGVGALMLQANPNLSPFDIRNIMQETATYRQCHYMGSNEPCAEDLIPKNRQNNVYGHGHVNSLEAVMEAAEYNQQYTFNSNLTLMVTETMLTNGNIVMGPGSVLEVDISESIDTVQWMSNDLRDSWSNIHSYDGGTTVVLDYDLIVEEIEHLPGILLHGNHTLSLRGLDGTTSSPLVSVDITLTEEVLVATSKDASSSMNYIVYGSVFAAIILSIVLLIAFINNESEKEAIRPTDKDIDEVVEAEIME